MYIQTAPTKFYVLLSLPLRIILVNNQLDTQFFSLYVYFDTLPRLSQPCRGGGLAGLNDLTGYAGGDFMFPVGPPKPDGP